MNPKILKIASKIKKEFLDESRDPSKISIFLCGGKKEYLFRKKVGEKLASIHSGYTYSVYYPEDMFIELILGHQKYDLLSLENLLADSVNAVVILLQSPGTFTELGAFANHQKLANKLLVVIEPSYRRAGSFINRGPIRYLEKKTKSKLLYLEINAKNLDSLVTHITKNVREISKFSQPLVDLSNPIYAYNFHLALVYVFDPIPKNSAINIANSLATERKDLVAIAAETVINSLISERKVSLNWSELSTTQEGIEDLVYRKNTRKRAQKILSFLSDLRSEALNLTLRKNHRRIWDEQKFS